MTCTHYGAMKKNTRQINKATMSYHYSELLHCSKCMCLPQIMWQSWKTDTGVPYLEISIKQNSIW